MDAGAVVAQLRSDGLGHVDRHLERARPGERQHRLALGDHLPSLETHGSHHPFVRCDQRRVAGAVARDFQLTSGLLDPRCGSVGTRLLAFEVARRDRPIGQQALESGRVAGRLIGIDLRCAQLLGGSVSAELEVGAVDACERLPALHGLTEIDQPSSHLAANAERDVSFVARGDAAGVAPLFGATVVANGADIDRAHFRDGRGCGVAAGEQRGKRDHGSRAKTRLTHRRARRRHAGQGHRLNQAG